MEVAETEVYLLMVYSGVVALGWVALSGPAGEQR